MIKQILISLICIIPTLSIAHSATMKDMQDVNTLLSNECKRIRVSCNIYIDTDNRIMNAYVGEDNNIIFTIDIVESLTKQELLAIGLHEVGHIYNRDRQKLKIIKTVYPNLLTNKTYRHNMEYNADRYAGLYFKRNGSHNYLIDCFEKSHKDKSKESITHPSINNRIQKLKEL